MAVMRDRAQWFLSERSALGPHAARGSKYLRRVVHVQ